MFGYGVSWRRFWQNFFSGRFFRRRINLDKNQEFVFLVDEARKEWHRTNNFFQEFKDQHLIDQAIFWQSAAEKRYVHLLKQAAREGIKADLETIVFLALADRNKDYGGVGVCQQKFGRLL